MNTRFLLLPGQKLFKIGIVLNFIDFLTCLC